MRVSRLRPWRAFALFGLLHLCLGYVHARDVSNIDLVKTHAGKVILLDFWASWCAPCRQSFPWMSEQQRRHGKERFAVIAINVDQDRALAEKFLAKTPAGFEVHYDPKGQLATALNIQAMPTSFVIDRRGLVIHTHTGFRDAQRAAREQQINELLQRGAPQ